MPLQPLTLRLLASYAPIASVSDVHRPCEERRPEPAEEV